MNVCEYIAKPMLRDFGISVPRGEVVRTPDEAADAVARLGACMVKAQVPTGKRGKAGGIARAAAPDEARGVAQNILGMNIGGFPVDTLLVEQQADISLECYAAVLGDASARGPLVLFSTLGGMDVEEAMERDPAAVRRIPVDILKGLDKGDVRRALENLDLLGADDAVAQALCGLYEAYRKFDAEIIEVNPLAISGKGGIAALDCKLVLDASSAERNPELARLSASEPASELEEEAASIGLKYIGLGGSVGVLANGAGLTMSTMDAISHFGGKPANFLEIGGEAYTSAAAALGIVLKNPNVRSLIVNFCGAFARTDVMAEGVVQGWQELSPSVPVFFSIHGTGDREAVALVRSRLGLEPYDSMDDAVRAAVAATNGGHR